MIEPRPYQQKALDIVAAMLAAKPLGQCHPVVEAPTGSGKSLIQAMLLDRYPIRTLAVTHNKELIEQNHAELLGWSPDADAGIYHAGIGRRETSNQITFCGIASVYKRAHEFGRVDLIMIDECHLVPNNSATMYRKLIDDCQRYNPQLVVIGLSATPYRLNNGLLTEGENALFTDIVPAKACGMSMRELIKMGYLAPVTTAPVSARLTTDGIKKTGGDFNLKDLADANDKDSITAACVDEIVRFGQDRRSWLVFAINVDHARHVAELMPVSTAVVTGDTPKGERERIIADYKAGKIRCLVNVNVLTTGFNAPAVDLLAFLRPTQSASLYIQMTGRAMRTADGKSDGLVLDFAGNIERLGPVDDVNVPKARKKKGGEAPIKECPDCFMLIAMSSRTCPYCAYEFPAPPPKLQSSASTASILSEEGPVRHNVTRWTVEVHSKPDKPKSLRITYYDGLLQVGREWICLYHTGRAGQKAFQFWQAHCGARFENIEEAAEILQKRGLKPDYIYTKKNGKWNEVISRGFDERKKTA